jgi:ABC-type nitrate/sulfonate/bicarbonate transport system ATPase subunit
MNMLNKKRKAPTLHRRSKSEKTRVAALARKTIAAEPCDRGVPAVSVRGLGLSFGGSGPAPRVILDGIDLDVREGEFLSIVGASGSGKTSLLRILAGLIRPSAGAVSFQGKAIAGPSRDRAIVFQDYSKALLPWRTVRGNIALGLDARGVAHTAQTPIIDELLDRTGLAHAADNYPAQLSGGMQQRVQIARCLAQQPRILLMDEPFGALDALTRQVLQDEILLIAAEKRITIVFITHDLEEAIYLGDRVVVLGGAPARVMQTVEIDLPRPRDQLTTREDPRFLAHRHRLFTLLAVERRPGHIGFAHRGAT